MNRLAFVLLGFQRGKLPARDDYTTTSAAWLDVMAKLDEDTADRPDGLRFDTTFCAAVRIAAIARASANPELATEAGLVQRWLLAVPSPFVTWHVVEVDESSADALPLPVVGERGRFGVPTLEDGFHQSDGTRASGSRVHAYRAMRAHGRVAIVATDGVRIYDAHRGEPRFFEVAGRDQPVGRDSVGLDRRDVVALAIEPGGRRVAWVWVENFRHQLALASLHEGKPPEPSGELVIVDLACDAPPRRLPIHVAQDGASFGFVNVAGRSCVVDASFTTFKLIDAETGDVTKTIGPFDADVRKPLAVRAVGDGPEILVNAWAKLFVHDLESGATRELSMGGARERFSDTAIAPDSAHVVARRHLGFEIWDLRTGEHRSAPDTAPYELGQDPAFVFHPSGDRFVTIGLGGALRMFAVSGELLAEKKLPRKVAHAGYGPWRCLYTKDGASLLSCQRRAVARYTHAKLTLERIYAGPVPPLLDAVVEGDALWLCGSDGVYFEFAL